MRNRPMILYIAILAVLMAGLTQGNAPAQSNLKGEEGWNGDNAYRFTEWGIVGTHDREMEEGLRMKKACRAGVLAAQFKALEQLADAGIQSVSGKVHVTKIKDMIVTEVKGFVKGGSVISQDFFPNENKCRVVYEIREPGLRQKVLAAVRKHAK